MSEIAYVNEQQPWSLVEVVASRLYPLKMALSSLVEDTMFMGRCARFAKLATINRGTTGACAAIAILCALITVFGRQFLLRPKLKVPILLEDEVRSSKERRLAYCYTPKELMEKGYEQVSVRGRSFDIQQSLQDPSTAMKSMGWIRMMVRRCKR